MRSRLDDARLVEQDHGLHAIADAELAADPRHVRLDDLPLAGVAHIVRQRRS